MTSPFPSISILPCPQIIDTHYGAPYPPEDNPPDNDIITISSPSCSLCGKSSQIEMTRDQYQQLTRPNRPHIQYIFPGWSAEARELVISGTHSDCWDQLFPNKGKKNPLGKEY